MDREKGLFWSLLVVSLLTTASVTPASAILNRHRSTDTDLNETIQVDILGLTRPPELVGNRINIAKGVDLEVPADEPCYVVHGWTAANWSQSSFKEKAQFMSPKVIFMLGIDYALIELDVYFQYNRSQDTMLKSYYIQFPENYFEGSHFFIGVWVWASEPEDVLFVSTITVNFITE